MMTICIAFIPFPTELFNVLAALAVAIIKGSLVALFFMHLKFEGKLIYIVITVPLILCVLIICADPGHPDDRPRQHQRVASSI